MQINLASGLRYRALRHPEQVAVVYEDLEVSYDELAARVDRMAAVLHGRGIGQGDIVAAFMKNSLAYLELGYATSHLGAVLLPMNYRLAAEEATYIHDHAGVKLLFADEEFREAVAALPSVVWLDEAAQRDSARLGNPGLPVPPRAEVSAQDLHRLMYTSGTTDRPKGVMHSYENYYWKWLEHVTSWDLSHRSRALVVGPMYHVAGWDAPGTNLLMLGGMYCLLREFDEARTLAAIQRHRITCLWLAPVMLGRILAFPDRHRYDVGSVELVLGGGEKTPEVRIREFNAYFPNARYADGYGMTETNAFDTVMPPGMELAKIGSAGHAVAHTEVDVFDDDGNRLPANQVGEICMRGLKVTRGYWKDPEKTAASFFGEWLRSGDVGYLDEEGYLYLTDRKKDMILSGAENIASSEVERVIYELPQVAECAVVGIPDPRWGESPVALVVLKPGAALDYAALERHCRGHLAGFKVPKALYLRDTLPRNPSGKILKRVLRDELTQLKENS